MKMNKVCVFIMLSQYSLSQDTDNAGSTTKQNTMNADDELAQLQKDLSDLKVRKNEHNNK